jgi:hypothetical protein
MGRRKAKTTVRGLGWAHDRARDELPDPAGAPCPYCARPMLRGQALDADHATPRALGAGGGLRWAHAHCNRAEGARLGNLLRGRHRPRWEHRWS